MTIPFGNRKIGDGEPVLVIAEIGINHEGNAETCARMIEAAAAAGADSIKLQTVVADENYAPGTRSHTLFKKAELPREVTAQMFAFARRCGVEPFTTCADPEEMSFIDSLDPAAHKISSGLLTAEPVVRQAVRTGRTVLMSTGMADWEIVDRAVGAARAAGAKRLGLFQCTSIYPAPESTLNLSAIRAMIRRYRTVVGFSDHSLGREAAPLAVAAGARMIEKHLTLDRSRADFDHALSLEPDEFDAMVRGIRAAEIMLGRADKSLNEVEAATAKVMHRYLVARRPINVGELLSQENIGIMRVPPGHGGFEPWDLDILVGRRAKHAIARFRAIVKEDVDW